MASNNCYPVLAMKRFVLLFLMLLMLTPGLACAMPSCTHKAEAQANEKPCHDKKEEHQGKQHGPMSSAECAKVDLQGLDGPTLKKPDTSAKTFSFFVPEVSASALFRLVDASTIRGPPPDWPSPAQTVHSILLTTQRIRE